MASHIYKETTVGEIRKALEQTPPLLRDDLKVLAPAGATERAIIGELVRIPKQQRINVETGRWDDE